MNATNCNLYQDDMLIAKEEIFGPVQTILKYKWETESFLHLDMILDATLDL